MSACTVWRVWRSRRRYRRKAAWHLTTRGSWHNMPTHAPRTNRNKCWTFGYFCRETDRETDREMFGFGFLGLKKTRPKPTDFSLKNRKRPTLFPFWVHNTPPPARLTSLQVCVFPLCGVSFPKTGTSVTPVLIDNAPGYVVRTYRKLW